MITVNDSEAAPAEYLQKVLLRALNTWEPSKPEYRWALAIADALHRGEQVIIYVKKRDHEQTPT